jgi:hypothetical protein
MFGLTTADPLCSDGPLSGPGGPDEADDRSRPWESPTFIDESNVRAARRLHLDPSPWERRISSDRRPA